MKFSELFMRHMAWHSETQIHCYIDDNYLGTIPVWSFYKHHFSSMQVDCFDNRTVILIRSSYTGNPEELEEEIADVSRETVS